MAGHRDFGAEEHCPTNLFHSIIAFSTLLGGIFFTLALVFLSIFVFPTSISFVVLSLLFLLIYIPIDDHSKFGRTIGRYTCKHISSYFPVNIHFEDYEAFQPNLSYVFGYEPHSVLPLGVAALVEHTGFMPLPKIKILGTSIIFYVPVLRHVWTWIGMAPVTRKIFRSLLNSGCSCIVVPGGVQETYFMKHDVETVFISSRRGFVRVAMEQGRPLVPIFCFGQTSMYKWWRPSSNLYLRFSRAIGVNPLCFWGVFGSPFPYRHPLHLVVGKPIEVNQNMQPTDEEIRKLHGEFVEALKDLFERHKAKAGYPDLHLNVI